jgi:hypothetical protein
MSDDLERMWKEVVDLIEVFSRNLPDGTQVDLKTLTVMMPGVPAEIRTKQCLNTNLENYCCVVLK